MPMLGKCGCCNRFADFMVSMAAVPLAIQGYGFDTDNPPSLQLVSPNGPYTQYYKWAVAYLGPAPGHLYRDDWYRKLKKTSYYTNGYKEIHEYEVFPWYYNRGANATDYVGGGTPSQNPADDLRRNGLPLYEESFETVTIIGTMTGPPVTGNVLSSMLDQSRCPPPVLRKDYMLQIYPADDPDKYGITVGEYTFLMREEWEYSESRSMGAVFSEAQALMEPLYEHSVDTRQGPLIFDYFNLDPCAHGQTSPGGSYDSSGKFTFSVAANQLYGMVLGPNEDRLNLWNDNAIYDDFSNAQGFPYYWGANDPQHVTGYDTVLFTYLKAPYWSSGTNAWTGAYIASQKDSQVFVSRTGTVHVRGTPNMPVTFKYGPGHVNRILVFRCGNATGPSPSCTTVKTSFRDGELPLYFAGKNTADFSAYTGAIGGAIVVGARIKIPSNPSDINLAYSACCVGDLLTYAPDLTLESELVQAFDYTSSTRSYYTTLGPGESVFGPGDISSPTGWGIIQSAIREWYFPVPPTNTAGNPNIGAGDQPNPL